MLPALVCRCLVPRTQAGDLRIFAISTLPRIRRRQQKLLDQERETPREYLDRESHLVCGQRSLFKASKPTVPQRSNSATAS